MISKVAYKLHVDSVDGGIPTSCLLATALRHDSQATIPLSYLSAARGDSCYDLLGFT